MKKTISFFVALIICNIDSLCYAQLDFKIENKTKIYSHKLKIKFVITNNTDETYIIPIDTTGFKSTFEENTQDDIDENFDITKGLSLSPLLYTNRNIYIEPQIKFIESLGRENEMISLAEKRLKEREIERKNWRNKNKIASKDFTWLHYNKYLVNSLLVINPNSSIEFEKEFLFEKFITYDDLVFKYAYYNLETGTYKIKFKIFLHPIRNYLTTKQKKIFNGKFYLKELESNFLQFNYER